MAFVDAFNSREFLTVQIFLHVQWRFERDSEMRKTVAHLFSGNLKKQL